MMRPYRQMSKGTGDTLQRAGYKHVGELQHREHDHPASLSQHANGHIPAGILNLSHRSSPTTANVSAAGVGRAGLALQIGQFLPYRRRIRKSSRSRRICWDQTRQTRQLFADIRRQYERVSALCPHIQFEKKITVDSRHVKSFLIPGPWNAGDYALVARTVHCAE
jgi:hypothetical protein